MDSDNSPGPPDLQAFASQKLAKVFGERRAETLLADLLRELRSERVSTVDDLARVAEALQSRGGFEAATGAMLGVHAQMLRMRAR